MTNLIDAINEVIKGVNIAYARNAYTMPETRTLINAIEFIVDASKPKPEETEKSAAPSAPARQNGSTI